MIFCFLLNIVIFIVDIYKVKMLWWICVCFSWKVWWWEYRVIENVVGLFDI